MKNNLFQPIWWTHKNVYFLSKKYKIDIFTLLIQEN